jgi:hypothetical protein
MGAEQRQRMEGLRLIVRGVGLRERGHLFRVRGMARRLVAGPEQRLHGAQEPLLARRRALGDARLGRGPQLGQGRARLRHFLVEPERLAEAQRLAPVGQREGGIDLLGGAKRIDASS